MTKDTSSFDRDEPTEPAFHTVKEASGYLHLCEKQVRRIIKRGDLRAYQFGTALRVKKEDIEAYVAAHQVQSTNTRSYKDHDLSG